MIPVVSLCRVSTAGQAADGRSGLERQRVAVEAAADRFGLDIIHRVELVDVDGSLVGLTAEWSQIKALIGSGRAAGIVVDSIDRLSRSTGFDLGVLQDLLAMQARVWTPEGEQSIAEPTGQLFTGLRALSAGYEKASIKRRMMGGADRRRAAGHWTLPPGQTPYGTAYDKSTGWSYVEPDISEVKRQFEEFAEDSCSMRTLAKRWGMRQGALSNRLRNPIYNGRLVCENRVTVDRRTGKQIVKPRKHVIDVPLAGLVGGPAIDDDLWARVQARLARNDRRHYDQQDQSAVNAPYLGIIYCSRCGERMRTQWGKHGGKRACYYRCKASIGGAECDAGRVHSTYIHGVIPALIVENFRDESWFLSVLSKASEARQSADLEAEKARVEKGLKALETQRGRLVEALVAGVFSLDEIAQKKSELDAKIEDHKSKLRGLEEDHRASAMEFIRSRAEAIVELCEPLIEVYGDMMTGNLDPAEAGMKCAPILKRLGLTVLVDQAPGRGGDLRISGIALDPAAVAGLVVDGCKIDSHALPCMS